jgi:hypothetical protein
MKDGNDYVNRVRRCKGCVHPFCPDEPIGYAEWFEWADKNFKKRQQVKCPNCRLWVCPRHNKIEILEAK